MMGDAHRHTDASDHNEVVGGRWPDGLRDYQWWITQETVDLMSHAPVFFGVYRYEHSLARPSGHRNVLYLKRGGPLRPVDREKDPDDNLPPNLWKWMFEHALTQPGQKVILVPHTFGESSQDHARFDCLLEIYQGARSSYESFRAPDGERRGNSQVDEPGHFAEDSIGLGTSTALFLSVTMAQPTTVGRPSGPGQRTARGCSTECTTAAPMPPATKSS